MSDDMPVACRLSDAELRNREATLVAQLKSLLIETEELADGYAFTLPGDEKCFAAAADLIMAERECCPFLTFELIAQPNLGPVIVRATGPGAAKEFLKSILT